jgi:hypothetical protein
MVCDILIDIRSGIGKILPISPKIGKNMPIDPEPFIWSFSRKTVGFIGRAAVLSWSPWRAKAGPCYQQRR